MGGPGPTPAPWGERPTILTASGAPTQGAVAAGTAVWGARKLPRFWAGMPAIAARPPRQSRRKSFGRVEVFLDSFHHRLWRRVEALDQFLHLLTGRRIDVGIDLGDVGEES